MDADSLVILLKSPPLPIYLLLQSRRYQRTKKDLLNSEWFPDRALAGQRNSVGLERSRRRRAKFYEDLETKKPPRIPSRIRARDPSGSQQTGLNIEASPSASDRLGTPKLCHLLRVSEFPQTTTSGQDPPTYWVDLEPRASADELRPHTPQPDHQSRCLD